MFEIYQQNAQADKHNTGRIFRLIPNIVITEVELY